MIWTRVYLLCLCRFVPAQDLVFVRDQQVGHEDSHCNWDGDGCSIARNASANINTEASQSSEKKNATTNIHEPGAKGPTLLFDELLKRI